MTTTRPAEFDARVMAYMPGLRKLAAKYTKTDEQREDLVTETVMYALEKWQNFREDGGFYQWLQWGMRAIVRNGAVKAAARSRNATMVPIEDHQHHLASVANQEDYVDLSDLVRRAKKHRNGKVVLRVAMGDTLTEIAKRRGVSKERVRQIVVETRKNLAAT